MTMAELYKLQDEELSKRLSESNNEYNKTIPAHNEGNTKSEITIKSIPDHDESGVNIYTEESTKVGIIVQSPYDAKSEESIYSIPKSVSVPREPGSNLASNNEITDLGDSSNKTQAPENGVKTDLAGFINLDDYDYVLGKNVYEIDNKYYIIDGSNQENPLKEFTDLDNLVVHDEANDIFYIPNPEDPKNKIEVDESNVVMNRVSYENEVSDTIITPGDPPDVELQVRYEEVTDSDGKTKRVPVGVDKVATISDGENDESLSKENLDELIIPPNPEDLPKIEDVPDVKDEEGNILIPGGERVALGDNEDTGKVDTNFKELTTWERVGRDWGGFGERIVDAWGKNADNIASKYDFSAMGAEIADSTLNTATNVVDAARNATSTFLQTPGDLFNAGVDFLNNEVSEIGDAIGSGMEGVNRVTKAAINKGLDIVENSNFVKGAKESWENIKDKVANWDEGILDALAISCKIPYSDNNVNTGIVTDINNRCALATNLYYPSGKASCYYKKDWGNDEKYDKRSIPHHPNERKDEGSTTQGKYSSCKPRVSYVSSISDQSYPGNLYYDEVPYAECMFGLSRCPNTEDLIGSRFGERVLDNDIRTLNENVKFSCINEKKRFKGYTSVSDLVINGKDFSNNKYGQHYSVGTSFYWDIIMELPDGSPLPAFPFKGWFPIQSYSLQGVEVNTNRVTTSMGDFEFLDSLTLPSSISLTTYETHRMDMDRWLNDYIDTVYEAKGTEIRVLPYKQQCIYIKIYFYDSNWIPIKSEKFICIPKPQFAYEGSSDKDPKLLTFNFSIVGRLFDTDDSSIKLDNGKYKPHVGSFKTAEKLNN